MDEHGDLASKQASILKISEATTGAEYEVFLGSTPCQAAF